MIDHPRLQVSSVHAAGLTGTHNNAAALFMCGVRPCMLSGHATAGKQLCKLQPAGQRMLTSSSLAERDGTCTTPTSLSQASCMQFVPGCQRDTKV
jgi:hypothetical protein